LKPIGPDNSPKPLRIDVTIRSTGVCFRDDDTLYCTNGNGQLAVAKSKDFAEIYTEQVTKPVAEIIDKLQPTGNVDPSTAISEIQEPARVQKCFPGERSTCHADIIVAPITPATIPEPGKSVDLALVILKDAVTFAAADKPENLITLPAGIYIHSIELNENGTPQASDDPIPRVNVHTRGISNEGKAIDQDVLGVLAPYADADAKAQPVIAEISGYCLIFHGYRVCVWRQSGH
jgi:hypothetical protein